MFTRCIKIRINSNLIGSMKVLKVSINLESNLEILETGNSRFQNFENFGLSCKFLDFYTKFEDAFEKCIHFM